VVTRLRDALCGLGEVVGWLVSALLVASPALLLLALPLAVVACANPRPVGTVIERDEQVVDGETHYVLQVVTGYDDTGEYNTRLVDAGTTTGCQAYEVWPDCDEGR
jgi:hypothetical protein